MTTLKHDAQGFLVGDHIDLSKAIKDWAGIRADVQAIKRALLGTPHNSPQHRGQDKAVGVAIPHSVSGPVAPRPRKAAIPNPHSVSEPVTPRPGKAAIPNPHHASQTGVHASPQRDQQGCFERRDGQAVADRRSGPGEGLAGQVASRIATAVRESSSGLGEVDPIVKAFREVAVPLSRGYELMTGSDKDKRQESWLRRIYSSLAGLRKEESIFNRAANRSLKNLEDKPVAQAGGGGGGWSLKSLLPDLPDLLPKLPTASGSGLLSGLYKAAKGLSKRAPMIAAAIEATGAIADIYDSETDDKLTRKEKDERAGSAVGGATGGVAGAIAGGKMGAAAGTVIAGPVGTVIGGVAGAALGGYLGHEAGKPIGQAAGSGVNQLRDAQIPKKMASAWADAKGYLLGASQSAGVDPGTLAKITNYESRFNSDAAPITKSGKRLSSAHGYGQFLDGTWTEMVNRYGAKYGVQDAGKLTQSQAAKYRGDKTVQAGMLAEFTRENIAKGRKWGGQDDDANVYAFHNLGDGDATKLLRNLKSAPDMSVRDAFLAGSTREKNRKRVEAVIAGNSGLYGDGSVTVAQAYARMGQKMREGEVFAQDARAAMSPQQPVSISTSPRVNSLPPWATPSIAQSVMVNSKTPTIPAMPPLPAIPDAPDITVPLASNSGPRQPVIVNTPRPDPGRDLQDRRIAHIVTGGLAGW